MFKYLNIEIFLSRFVRWGLYAAIFAPFIFARAFMFPLVTPKVFGFHILVEIIFAAWLLLYIFTYLNISTFKVSSISLALLALLAVLLITAATGVNFERSFWSTQERGIGIFSLFHFGAFFLVLSDFIRRGFVNLESYLKVALIAGFGVAAGAVWEVFWPQTFLFSSGSYRPGSFFGNPTYLASYLIFHIFIAFWFAVRTSKFGERALWLGLAAFDAAIVVFLTQTRGAIVGLGAGFLFLLGWLASSKRMVIATARSDRGGKQSQEIASSASPPRNDSAARLSTTARILLAIILLLAAVFWFSRAAPLWQEIPGVSRIASLVSGEWDVGPRILSWQVAWKSFLERPLSGWGFENFKYAMDHNFHPSLFRYGFGETYWDKPHNIFLEYLVAGGILGIAAFFWLFWAAFRAVYRLPLGIFFGAALAAHLVSNSFVFDTFGSYLMFFILLAAADSAAPSVSFRRTATGVETATVTRHSEGDMTRHTGVMIYHNTAVRAVIAVVIAIAALVLVAWNVNILYANNRHYWGANYFVNDLPEEALQSFRKSLTAPFNPYVNATRRDFGDLVTQMYTQKKLPEPEKNLPWAVGEVDKAIGEDPNNYYLYLSLSNMIVNFYELNPGQLLGVGQAAIDKAIELSNRQQNYYVKAKLHLIKNENIEAIEAMEKAVALDPQIGDPHFYYALTLLEIGETGKGFAELKAAEELGRIPNTAEEARTVANYYGDAQMWQESVFWYKIAITKDPSDSEARLKLGLVYYMSGKIDLAKEEISRVMQKTDLRTSPAYELLLPILQELGLTP